MSDGAAVPAGTDSSSRVAILPAQPEAAPPPTDEAPGNPIPPAATEPLDPETRRLLEAWKAGDGEALDELIPLVMRDLKRIAHAYLRREGGVRTLQTTGLVHEMFLRLKKPEAKAFEEPALFFRFAARTMRQILVDHARHRRTRKRGGDAARVSLPANLAARSQRDPAVLLALDKALERLAARSRLQAELIELKFFAGLTIEELMDVAALGRTKVIKESRLAMAFLKRELGAQ